MSRHDDPDSPDYQEFSAGGDGRTTPEEREIARLEKEVLKLTVHRDELAGHLRCFVAVMEGRSEEPTPTMLNMIAMSKESLRRMKL